MPTIDEGLDGVEVRMQEIKSENSHPQTERGRRMLKHFLHIYAQPF